MTLDEAKALITHTCHQLDVSRPRVVAIRGYAGRYRPPTCEIGLPIETFGAKEVQIRMIVTHELAHYLDHWAIPEKRGPQRKLGHTRSFYDWLLTTIREHYAAPQEYPWKFEYRRIIRWAIKDGYATTDDLEHAQVLRMVGDLNKKKYEWLNGLYFAKETA